jgi:AcrR family transcriptional regulator
MESAKQKGAKRIKKTLPRGAALRSKSSILSAALKVFANHSFEGSSLQQVAVLAGIGQPLLHYHFGSKTNLWKAAVDFAFHDLTVFFATVDIATVDLEPIDVIRVLCRSFLSFSSKHPEHALIFINEMRVPGERFEWLLDKYLRPIHDRLDTLLEHAKRRHQIKDIPVVHLTNTIVVILVHFFTIGPILAALYDTKAFDSETIASHANHTMQILFDGMTLRRDAVPHT